MQAKHPWEQEQAFLHFAANNTFGPTFPSAIVSSLQTQREILRSFLKLFIMRFALKKIKLAMALVCWAGLATAQDCSELNTAEFLEQTSWEKVLACVENDPEAFLARNQQGYNLLMTAVGASIHPMALDDLFVSVPEDKFEDVISAIDKSGRSLAHIAASEAQNPAMFSILSRYGVSLFEEIDKDDNPGWAGRTPLHFAAQRNDAALVVAALLTTGGAVYEDGTGVTPFNIAMDKEFIGLEALMLAEGEWPTVYRDTFDAVGPSDNADCTNFLTAAFFEKATEADVVACLTDKIQLMSVDRDGNSLLHLAAAYSMDGWILSHILAFADDPVPLLGKRNSAGLMPLHLAAQQNASPDNLAHLLAWGADPNALVGEEKRMFGKNRGLTALHIVSSQNDEDRLARTLVLLAFDADTFVQDVGFVVDGKSTKGGRTALHRALLFPDSLVLATLLQGQFWQESLSGIVTRALRGHTVKQIADDAGRTALHFAASRQSDFDSLWSLITYGFSVDASDSEGRTPLMYAAQNFSDSENFLYLLEQSEDPCRSSSSGATVEALLRTNEALIAVVPEDASGKTLSPLAILKQRCP